MNLFLDKGNDKLTTYSNNSGPQKLKPIVLA